MWPATAAATVPRTRLTSVQWLICAVAAVGFAFDTFEITVFSVCARPALLSFGVTASSASYHHWAGWLLFLPQACGGVFGLIGGNLTDRFGRRGILTWSIVLYSLASLGAAHAGSIPALLFWRCLCIVGACVEYVAGIAWLAEMFADPDTRQRVISYTQALSATGGIAVNLAYWLAVTYGDRLPMLHGTHDAWRYTLLVGLAPALPLVLVRPFLPESPLWRQQRREGVLRRPRLSELFAPDVRRTTCVAALLAACSFGIAVGVIQQMPRIVPGAPSLRSLPPRAIERAVVAVHVCTNAGDLAGRLLFAWLVVRIGSQRRLMRRFLLPGVIVTPLIYLIAPHASLWVMALGGFVATALMVGQLSFWGNYLPRMYPTRLRCSGESFAINAGGRIVGTSAAVLVTSLAATLAGAPSVQLATAAAAVAAGIYAVAILVVRWLPEPARAQLPE